MKLVLHLTVCILFLLAFAEAGRWEDGDTVIIDAFPPDDDSSLRNRRQLHDESANLDEDTILIKSQRCVTPRGRSGQCMSLRECYPVLFPADPTVELPEDSTLSNNLTDLLIAASGFCGGGEYQSDSPSLFAQVVRSEVQVCCVPQSKTPPPLPPQQPPNATVHDLNQERSGCGLIKIDPKIIPPPPTASVEDEIEGKNGTGGRIVNGREAIRGEFPWIVALMSSGRQFCGGSMIDSQNVVTAAHCVQHMGAAEVQKLTIQIGDHDIATTGDKPIHEVRTASRILYHRGFSMQHLHHDVALITLSKPVSFTTYIQPVCLHQGSPGYDNVQSDVTGWGQLYDNGPQPTKLQTAAVKVLSHNDCVQKYSGNNQVTIGRGMVCAGGEGKDSCRGDSGGPLTINSKSRAQLVGIVSWGIGCGSYPGVYTRVDQYLQWINKNRKRSFAY